MWVDTLELQVWYWLQRCSPQGRLWLRGRPQGHILKFLALASKIKSLASKLQVLKNCPVLGSRTALFFEPLKFCWKKPKTSRKICEDRFCVPLLEIAWNKILKTVFLRSPEKVFEDLFFENFCACFLGPLPRAFLSLVLKVSVLRRAALGLKFFMSFFLASSFASSTPPLIISFVFLFQNEKRRWRNASAELHLLKSVPLCHFLIDFKLLSEQKPESCSNYLKTSYRRMQQRDKDSSLILIL